MRRVHVDSLGNSDKADVVTNFDGSLSSLFIKREARFFVENVSSIQHTTVAPSVGRALLENSWIDGAFLDIGADPESLVDISVLINSEMTVTSAFLYVNTVNTIPGTATVDITSGISGSNLDWTYDVGAPNAQRYFWVELVDANANSSITPLGSYTTEDNTLPTVDSATMALGTPPTSSIDLTFAASDNDAIQSIYIWLSNTQTTLPTATQIKASGSALPNGSTSLTMNSLSANTTYYGWIMAKDQVGNESAVQAFSPGSLTTNSDTVAPTVDSFNLSAGTNAETQVDISLTISDTA